MTSAAEIYAAELSSRGHGLPLWIPEPTDSGEVLIGDVGYVWRGAFFRLFNVTRAADDPVNRDGVPDDFEVLTYARQAHHRIKDFVHGALCSRTVRSSSAKAGLSADVANVGFSYKFECTASRGAALVMRDAGVLEEVHASGPFEDYFKRHRNSWEAYATRGGLPLGVEDFLLVRGYIKTTAWGVAAFMGGSNAHELSFQADGASFINAQFSVSNSVGVDPSIERRVGPPPLTSQRLSIQDNDVYTPVPGLQYDQCVFVHALKCKRRSFFPGFKIKAAAEPRDPSVTEDKFPETPDSVVSNDERRFDEEYDFEGTNPVQCRTAVDDVLDYILDSTNADLAIASDLEVRMVNSAQLHEGKPFADAVCLKSTLQRMKPAVNIDNHGVGTMLPILDESTDESELSISPPDHLLGGSLGRHRHTLTHVHLAQHHYTERKCVIKVMKKNHLVELGHDMQIRRGLKALRASQSPFVVHFLSAFQDHNYLFIATSYVSDVTLLHLIQRFSHFSETNTRFYAAEIVSALRFLHDSSVIHGAVTPQNCLIGSDGHIQLCGFTYAYLATSEYQPFSCDPATFVDLAHYLAPEVLREEIVTPSADWYALGVMLYQMLVGVTPQRIDEPLRLLSEYSDSVQNLFGKLTNDDPLARDSDVQSHEWFAGIDWTQVEDLGLEPPYEPVCDDRDIEFPRQHHDPHFSDEEHPSYASKFPEFTYRPRKFSAAHAPKHPLSCFQPAGQASAFNLARSMYPISAPVRAEPATAHFSVAGASASTGALRRLNEQHVSDLWMDAFWKASLVAY